MDAAGRPDMPIFKARMFARVSWVHARDRMGRVSRSGSASTDHLHVELRRQEGGQAFALDPGPLLTH